MEIKDIQVFFAGDKREFVAFDQASVIAKDFGASTKILYITPDVEFAARYMLASSPTSSVYDQYYKAIQHEYKQKQKKAQDVFAKHPEHQKFNFQHDYGRCRDSVSFNGKFTDINIFCRDIEQYDIDFEGVIEAAIFETGKPVLVVPPEYPAQSFKNIVIGWDGSSRASRAVSSALPLLRKAENVFIVTIDEKGKDTSSSKNLLVYLESHGVKAHYRSIPSASQSIGETILDFSRRESANLIVMGAFAHSRFRESILGGVTKYMLRNTPVPIFMEH